MGHTAEKLAITLPQRLAAAPELPALAETVPGLELTGWNAVWAPGGTPPAVIDRVARELRDVLQEPELRRRFADLGIEPDGSGPAALAERTRLESEQWARLIRQNNIKAD